MGTSDDYTDATATSSRNVNWKKRRTINFLYYAILRNSLSASILIISTSFLSKIRCGSVYHKMFRISFVETSSFTCCTN